MARTAAPERTAAGTRINVTAQGRKWQTVAPSVGTLRFVGQAGGTSPSPSTGTLRFVGKAPTVTKTGA